MADAEINEIDRVLSEQKALIARRGEDHTTSQISAVLSDVIDDRKVRHSQAVMKQGRVTS
jgi:hypothetical protein